MGEKAYAYPLLFKFSLYFEILTKAGFN